MPSQPFYVLVNKISVICLFFLNESYLKKINVRPPRFMVSDALVDNKVSNGQTYKKWKWKKRVIKLFNRSNLVSNSNTGGITS